MPKAILSSFDTMLGSVMYMLAFSTIIYYMCMNQGMLTSKANFLAWLLNININEQKLTFTLANQSYTSVQIDYLFDKELHYNLTEIDPNFSTARQCFNTCRILVLGRKLYLVRVAYNETSNFD